MLLLNQIYGQECVFHSRRTMPRWLPRYFRDTHPALYNVYTALTRSLRDTQQCVKFAPDNHLLLGHSHFHHQACFTHHLPERERDVPRRPLSSKSFNAFAEMDVQKNIFSCASLTHAVKHSLVVYQWSVDGRPQSWSWPVMSFSN